MRVFHPAQHIGVEGVNWDLNFQQQQQQKETGTIRSTNHSAWQVVHLTCCHPTLSIRFLFFY